MKIIDRKVITFTPDDVKAIIAKEIKAQSGCTCSKKDIDITITRGDGPYDSPRLLCVTAVCDISASETEI